MLLKFVGTNSALRTDFYVGPNDARKVLKLGRASEWAALWHAGCDWLAGCARAHACARAAAA